MLRVRENSNEVYVFKRYEREMEVLKLHTRNTVLFAASLVIVWSSANDGLDM